MYKIDIDIGMDVQTQTGTILVWNDRDLDPNTISPTVTHKSACDDCCCGQWNPISTYCQQILLIGKVSKYWDSNFNSSNFHILSPMRPVSH